MNTGIGFFEIVVIGMLVLLLFGSKEMLRIFRQAARLISVLQQYRERFKTELEALTHSINNNGLESTGHKQLLRKHFEECRKSIEKSHRLELSQKIHSHLFSNSRFQSSGSVMVYCSKGAEVDTSKLIRAMIKQGKRVVVPYCVPGSRNIGIAEITDHENDLSAGEYGIPEPAERLRGNFFKSDVGYIICPGIAFDRKGTRLGRGGGYYDRFLSELKGRVPIIGLAFDCQVSAAPLPGSPHDVKVDQVITPDGPQILADLTSSFFEPAPEFKEL